MHRRHFLKAAALVPVCGTAPAAPGRSYLESAPDMLVVNLCGRLNALAAKWDAVRGAISTADAQVARNRFVRDKTIEMLGGFPARNPLAPVVVRTHQRRGYRVESVMYQSRPDFWVTGNLYVPNGLGPFPAVLSPCGHYPLARMYPEYQFAYLNLVHAGFVVLAYDPIGQGERRHFWNPTTSEGEINDPIYEHSLPGMVLLLMGENLTQYRVWDGMRGIDYLLTRPEVDKDKIGCAGHSGGGTLTLFISAVDERVKCAVVNEGGTTHRWPVDVPPGIRLPAADIEQNLFPSALYGADLCDLHQTIAPRPLMAMIEDFSPRFNSAADHIRECYSRLGAPDRFATVAANDPHAWTVKLRLAATDWLSRTFYNKAGPTREPAFEAERPETLYCTPNGSIRHTHRGETIHSLLQKRQAALSSAPPRDMQAEIRALLRIGRSNTPLDSTEVATTPRKGYQVVKAEFVSEPGIFIPVWIFMPERRQGREAILFLSDAGKESDGMELGLYEKLCLEGWMVISADVRGIGETRPPHAPPTSGPLAFRHLFDTETAASYMTWYMDESLFGMRVGDVLRAVDYALSRPDVGSLRVVGQGAGALWAMYAAALDRRIGSVVAERGLASYRSLAQTDRYTHNAGIFVRGVLNHFDLPHVAAAIAPRALTLVAPVDAMKHPLPEREANEVYRATAEAYRAAGAGAKFRIAFARGEAMYTAG